MKTQRGYIALMTALVISAILVLIAVSGGLSGFFSRFSALDDELKAQSLALADSCGSQVRLALINDPNYIGGQAISLGDGSCAILPTTSDNPRTFKISAQTKDAHTNLIIVLDANSADINSWQEVASF